MTKPEIENALHKTKFKVGDKVWFFHDDDIVVTTIDYLHIKQDKSVVYHIVGLMGMWLEETLNAMPDPYKGMTW